MDSVSHDAATEGYTNEQSAYNTDANKHNIMNIPMVTSRQEGAAEVRVFMLENEREQLKQACTSMKTNMSHILRVLALQWLSEQDQNPKE